MGEKKYARYGDRLRKERNIQKAYYPEEPKLYNNKYIGVALNYSENYVSKFFSGEKKLEDRQYKVLADYWGVRVEYLKCDDDFRTEDDMLTFMSEKDRKEFKTIQEYLKILNIEFVPYIRTVMSVNKKYISENADALRQYITNINEILGGDDTIVPIVFRENTVIPKDLLRKIQGDTFQTTILQHQKERQVIQTPIIHYKESEIKRMVNAYNYNSKSSDLYDYYKTMNTRTDWTDGSPCVSFRLYRNKKYVGDCIYWQIPEFITSLKALTSCAFDSLVRNSRDLNPDASDTDPETDADE